MGMHMKTLWSILSGSNIPSSLDLVGPYIEKAKDEIVAGLAIYKPAAENVPSNMNFANILSKAINLEEGLTEKDF